MSGVSVISDRPCQLGEGPAYDPATGTLYWFDIIGMKLLEKRMPDGELVVHDLPVMASALAVVDANRQLLVTERGLELRDKASGRLTLHKAIEADNPLTRSNDSRVHPSGAFWIGTMAKEEEVTLRARSIGIAQAIAAAVQPIAIPNSICFSADGATAYYVDSRHNRLMRVSCDPATGLPIGEPRLFYDGSGEGGGIDGSVVDADGVLWNAHWGKARVDAFSPEVSCFVLYPYRLSNPPVPSLSARMPRTWP